MAQFTLPSASPKQMLIQDFGLGKITILYSRPSLRGRSVFGENSLLAPIDSLWRTGADSCTQITFSDTVIIADTVIESGTYSLFSIPGINTWELILNKGIKGIGAYNSDDDVIRLSVPVKQQSNYTETFTINLQQIGFESCVLQLSWASVEIELTIETKIVERLKESYEEQLQSETKPHFMAAYFYHLLGNDNQKALDEITVALENNSGAYYMHYLKSRIEIALGKKDEAKSSAQNTLEAAIAAGSSDYQRLANDLLSHL